MLIDSHCHLDFPDFADDLDAIVARAADAGVGRMVTISTRVRRLSELIAIAERFDNVYCSVGTHPHHADEEDGISSDELVALTRHPKVVALGEAGLDYFYDHSPREVQKQVFVMQMELARAAKLPIVIHCRPSQNSENAWDDYFSLVSQHWESSGLGGILHCFTGNAAQAKRALDMDFLVSFAGNITFPKAQQIRDAALEVPLDRMLIETDSPFLAPVPFRGKRNEPAFVKEVARQLGELRGFSPEEIGARTTQNFQRFFSLHEKRTTV